MKKIYRGNHCSVEIQDILRSASETKGWLFHFLAFSVEYFHGRTSHIFDKYLFTLEVFILLSYSSLFNLYNEDLSWKHFWAIAVSVKFLTGVLGFNTSLLTLITFFVSI